MRSEMILNKGYKDINPVQFGYETCEKSHAFGPALRTHWLLHFVVSGKGYFRIEEREYHLGAGNIFVIPPFVETYYEADAEKPWEYIWVGFSMSEEIPITLGDVIFLPGALHLFEEMKQCGTLTIGRTEFLCAKIWQLLAQIMDKKEETVDHVENALHLIRAEYMSGLTVERIADSLNLDRTYFSALFKKKMGVSPKQYLLRYRMEQAMDLLKNHGHSVSVTALSVGYNDVYVFSKMFKQYYGFSPSECRQKRG